MINNKYIDLFNKIKKNLIERINSPGKFKITPADKFKLITNLNENHILRFPNKFYLSIFFTIFGNNKSRI